MVSSRSVVGEVDSLSSNYNCKFRRADSSTDFTTHKKKSHKHNNNIQ